jgi:hypothetical protein
MTTAQHLAQPFRREDGGNVWVTFRPIYCHPFTGWEIVKVEPKR